MIFFIIRRILLTIPLLFGVSIITFLIINLAPGGPLDIYEFRPNVDVEVRKKLIDYYGLDKPLLTRYFNWLKKFITLDFGNSFKDFRPVTKKILERLPYTLLLNTLSLFIIFYFGVLLGIYTARKSKLISYIEAISFFILSMPTFWIALLLILLFGVKLGIFPITGITSINFDELSTYEKIIDVAKHLVLPVIASSIHGVIIISRYVSSSMRDVMNEGYVLYATVRGIDRKKIFRKYILKNSLMPLITIIGLSIPDIIGGSFIFETIFSFPGIGRLGFEAMLVRDYPTIMALGVITSFFVITGNMIADILYYVFDPRLR